MIPAHDFYQDALCAQIGEDLFFPAQGNHHKAAQAKRICGECPVRKRCLESALALPYYQDEYGVFGGLAPRERNAIRRERAREAA